MALEFEEAVMGIMAAVANADGRVADEEAAWWLRMRHRHPFFRDVPHDAVEDMQRRAQDTLTTTSWAEAIDAWAKDVPAEHAETIYRLALELQFADGDCSRQESKVTAHLAHALRLSPERSTHLFETALVARLGD